MPIQLSRSPAPALAPNTGSDSAAAGANPIVSENLRPGNPSEDWDVPDIGDGTYKMGDLKLQGFATDISVNVGEFVSFKIRIQAPPIPYHIDIYRLGWYGGLGARRVDTIRPDPSAFAQVQPACLIDSQTGLIDCGNWSVSASWPVPASAVSGIYLAKLVREDILTGRGSHIVFVVRDDARRSDILLQTSDTTWHAYNAYLDEDDPVLNVQRRNSLYGDCAGGKFPDGRAFKVSYNRPFDTRSRPQTFGAITFLFDGEYPMVRWLEANGYDVTYCTGVDTDRDGAALLRHRVFLSVGHDEYWSAQQRANVEAARAAGVHLGFFSGNEVFWKTRWEDSSDGSATPYRTLVCYKESYEGRKIDPTPIWTGTWRDVRLSPPADGDRPENALTGTIFTVNAYRLDTISVPAELGRLRFWRNTDITALAPGATATLTPNVLGFEWDEDLDNGARPPGLMQLSATTIAVDQRLLDGDAGTNYAPGVAFHSLTLYRHASGALVFGAGTTRWAWGLDDRHDSDPSVPDMRMRQATVNLLADMGVQPPTLQPGLVAAEASTDTTAPHSVIALPENGASIPQGHSVIVSGTAADAEGVVAAVEVSVDGGTTWHPATGDKNWTFSWRPQTNGAVTILSRAVDDSGNLETPGPGIGVTVVTPAFAGSIWDDATVPTVAAFNDPGAVELGLKFRSNAAGAITGIRFYKGAGNTGPHVGTLWTARGTLLASVSFTAETASGWQQANLPSPVAVTAGTMLVVSYHAPAGHYAADGGYFSTSGVASGPLHALGSSEAGGNGVFVYGSESAFPTNSFNATNYWVDVVFSPVTA